MIDRWRMLTALTLLAAACTSPTDAAPNTGSALAPILGGKKDTSHTAVLGVVYDGGNNAEFCTGYLISHDLVLTARHCVSSIVNPNGGCTSAKKATPGETFPVDKMLVFTEASPTGPESGLPVAEILTFEADGLCGNDVALLRLETPLTDLAPLPLRVDGPPIADEPLTVVGYGATKGGPDTTSGVRRSRDDAAVLSIGASATTVEGEWIVTQGPCAGDSGGPAIDASGASIGVMSRGNQNTCEEMIYERLDVHAEWLKSAARASAERLAEPLPAWAADGSGSGSAGGSAGGAAGSAAAGASGSTATGGTGGSSSEGGAGGEPGAGAQGPAPTSSDEGCSVARPPAATSPGALRGLAGLAALAVFLRGRRNGRVSPM